MNQGIEFDMTSGPSMSGTWRNPQTGDSFTVRDTFFQDNQFMVQTTDNRLLDYNYIQDYIKLEKETEKDTQMINNIFKSKNNSQIDDIPEEVKNLIEPSEVESNMILPEDENLVNRTITNPRPPFTPQNNMNVVSEDDIFIKRALTNTVGPDLNINIDWSTYPKEKIHMLRTLFDVKVQNIVSWYMKNMDITEIRKNIEKTIINYIEGIEDIKESEKTPTLEINVKKPKINPKRKKVSE